MYFYTDGTVTLTKAGELDTSKKLRVSGRMCANAKYNAAGVMPGYANRAQMKSVTIAADMAQFGYVNMNYWFYSLTAVTKVEGIGNLARVREMQYAFTSCTGLAELDFRGFDPSSLTNVYMAFVSCSNLTTIYADATWALPASGVSGTSTFYNCSKLVGGNGTAYSSSMTGYAYFRIDKSGQAGYLTAA